MNNYILTITSKGADAVFKLTYKDGVFFRLEAKRQDFKENQRDRLMQVIPHLEKGLEINSYNGVTIERELKEQSEFTQYLSEYSAKYLQLSGGLQHRMNGIEGNALKAIIKHLESISTTPAEAFILWQQILSNWDKIEPFYAKQMELRQINTNINIILRQVKYGGTGKSKTANYADDIRGSL